jgi:hypothetical protein
MSDQALDLKTLMNKLAAFFKTELHMDGAIFQLRAPLPGGRSQLIGATQRDSEGRTLGIFFSEIGTLNDQINLEYLLRKNIELGYSKIAVMDDEQGVKKVGIIAVTSMEFTSPQLCVQILEEVAKVADSLEHELFGVDIA